MDDFAIMDDDAEQPKESSPQKDDQFSDSIDDEDSISLSESSEELVE